jgi:hypothetical protein
MKSTACARLLVYAHESQKSRMTLAAAPSIMAQSADHANNHGGSCSQGGAPKNQARRD